MPSVYTGAVSWCQDATAANPGLITTATGVSSVADSIYNVVYELRWLKILSEALHVFLFVEMR